jgi:hypothetical protein
MASCSRYIGVRPSDVVVEAVRLDGQGPLVAGVVAAHGADAAAVAELNIGSVDASSDLDGLEEIQEVVSWCGFSSDQAGVSTATA